MAYIANKPAELEKKITRTLTSNATATNELVGPKQAATGGGTSIPTSGLIWWPRK